MSAAISGLIPEFRPWARELYWVATRDGMRPRITSTRRSFAVQSRLYQRFLAGGSAYPAAPPGTSAHEFGYAMDMVVQPLSALSQLGAVWLNWGGVWSSADAIHFEYPGFPHPARKDFASFWERVYKGADVLSNVFPLLTVQRNR